MVQGDRIQGGIHAATSQQRLNIGCEPELVTALAVVERLDPHPVPGQEQLLFSLIPDSKGKHPLQLVNTALTPGVPRLEYDLAIAIRIEVIALLFQRLPQSRVVVNRAVEYQRQSQLLIHHGLIGPLGEVYNGKASMSECQRPVTITPRMIRTALIKSVGHSGNRSQIRPSTIETQLATNSTH